MIRPPHRDGARRSVGRRGSEAGQADPPARWAAFVSASPRWFAPPITTVLAEGPSAEWFDRSLPRHPPEGGPGACCTSLEPAQIGSVRPSFPVIVASEYIAESRQLMCRIW